MDLFQFKSKSIKKRFGIDEERFGIIFSFIDFGNVNYWFEDDIRDKEGNVLKKDQKLVIDLKKLGDFSSLFSKKSRFYFGLDSSKRKSVGFISRARDYFDNVITKEIQEVKHYLKDDELQSTTRSVNQDLEGSYIYIPKCNFDVEISVDAIRLIDKYDTFCLFSSDADFISLVRFLKKNKKKFILVKSGYVKHDLINPADSVIKAQDIK